MEPAIVIAIASGRFTVRATLAATALFAFATLSIADIDGAKDHPLAGRFEGSSIVYYKAHAFDEVALLKAPLDYGALLDRNALDDRSGPEWLTLQGKSHRDPLRDSRGTILARGHRQLSSLAQRQRFRGRIRLCGQGLSHRQGHRPLRSRTGARPLQRHIHGLFRSRALPVGEARCGGSLCGGDRG